MGNYGEAFGEAVAEQLRAERSAARISQKELAARTGLSEQSVMRYLNGVRDIPMVALADIAEALGLSVETVIDRASERVSIPDNVIVGSFGQTETPIQERGVAFDDDGDSGEDDTHI